MSAVPRLHAAPRFRNLRQPRIGVLPEPEKTPILLTGGVRLAGSRQEPGDLEDVSRFEGRDPPGPVPIACARPIGPGEVILYILRTAPEGALEDRKALGISLIDRTVGAGTVATIYSDRVAALARDALSSRIELLGRTMAHEIGHLLMGSRRHAARGLMRAVFSPDELRRCLPRDWVFSQDETLTMRHVIEGRPSR